MRPSKAIEANSGLLLTIPLKQRNMLMNVEKPGKPTNDNTVTINTPLSIGIRVPNPLKPSTVSESEPDRAIIIPSNINRAVTVIP